MQGHKEVKTNLVRVGCTRLGHIPPRDRGGGIQGCGRWCMCSLQWCGWKGSTLAILIVQFKIVTSHKIRRSAIKGRLGKDDGRVVGNNQGAGGAGEGKKKKRQPN